VTTFEKIINQMLDVHRAKNHDYSAEGQFGNFAESERVGVEAWRGAFVRLQDKYMRCCNLIARDGESMVLDEKLEDTLLDLANYAVIVLCLLKDEDDEDDEEQGEAFFMDEKMRKLSELLDEFPGAGWDCAAKSELHDARYRWSKPKRK
jgi:hypothetical protein